jgi:tetratricopeptide (TPR) repeat protein
MLRLAGGFALGFARVNHPSLRRRLVEEIRQQLTDAGILEVTLSPAAQSGIVAQLGEAVGDRRPSAVFAYGLESLIDLREPFSDSIGMFNFNRDYVVRRFPWPVVFWVPEFAVRGFRRQAIDFWSGRSGVYRFVGDEEEARATVEELAADFDWSLERREILRGVLTELERSGQPDLGALARVLMLLAQAAGFESDWAEAEGHLSRALPIYRQIGGWLGEANCLFSQGRLARETSNAALARQALQAAAAIYAAIGLADRAERARREASAE